MMPDAVRYLLRNYTQICEQMSDAIRRDGRPQKVFYLELGMSRATFDRRMRRHDWRPEELGVLVGMVKDKDEGGVPKDGGRRRKGWWKWW